MRDWNTRRAVFVCALALSLGAAGCARPTKATTPEEEKPAVRVETPKRQKHYAGTHKCGALTTKGKLCKRAVSNGEGTDTDVEAHCWQHKHKARKPEATNPCYRPAGSAPVEDCYYIDGDVTRPINGRP